ncbi:MAG: Hsp20/alpha crystallin family protein [Myxococcota bacterium]
MITVRNRERFNELFWGPGAELDRFQRDIDQLFFGNRSLSYRRRESVPANTYADAERAVVQLSVPGYDASALDLGIEGSTLTVRGEGEGHGEENQRREFSPRPFERSFELPFSVDADQIRASLNDGILEIELPRAEADKPRTIAIQS